MTINILADASLSHLQTAFPEPFTLTTYTTESAIPHLLPGQEILLCRSTLKVGLPLLSGHSLRYVATASSGTDHIDNEALQSLGISLIDAKGSNADAVTDYVMASLAYLMSKKHVAVEAVGVIGVGMVGSNVCDRLQALGFPVLAYDPPRAESDPAFSSCTKEALLSCNLLCVHASYHQSLPHPSENLLDLAFLSQLKPGSAIINAARGGIVNENALLALPNPPYYITDVYLQEPLINQQIVQLATLCTPHIAGHSLEAKSMAITQISQALHAAYGLPPPIRSLEQNNPLPFPADTYTSWQQLVLSLYNPEPETRLLKNAPGSANAFTTLRRAHHFRHDFKTYDFQGVDEALIPFI